MTTSPAPDDVPVRTEGILDRLAALRAADAPTHGGHVLSYVYDPGLAELDDLAAAAMRAVQPVNGLDPTTFTSVAVMERELVGFARDMLHGPAHGPGTVVGSVTSGGTESCLLAVKIARDTFRAAHAGEPARPRVVVAASAHAAFRKAAHYLDVALTVVPVDPASGLPDVAAYVAELDSPDVALAVVSAPSYPHGVVDPVEEVAAAAAARGVPVHVDACVGGWVLPFWPGAGGGDVVPFDFAVPGVTSISADVHKYGYAPKGTSVLLVRGRDRQRRQFFATTAWPGYPVVNAGMSGSRPAGPLAAAWAVSRALGVEGYTALTARCVRATRALHEAVAQVEGLRVVGSPTGPLVAVATDESVAPGRRVDPHLWADAARTRGWVLQPQPGLRQDDGTLLPHTTHLTVTPVTEATLPELLPALVAAADEVRGQPRPDPSGVLAALTPPPGEDPTSDELWAGLATALAGGAADRGPDAVLPDRMAELMAVMEAIPGPSAERLLTEILARVAEPHEASGEGS